MLVIACVAAVMLRDGHWWARLWAWVVIVVLLAAIGTTDVLHAMNYTLRHRPTEGIVAAAPVVAVLLAFSLLLTLLRQSRTQAPEPAGPAPLGGPGAPGRGHRAAHRPARGPGDGLTVRDRVGHGPRPLPVLREDTLPGDVPPTPRGRRSSLVRRRRA